ncbi:MAG: PAS domain S-box protein [Phycisphaeraceae bacterium]|nr:PAS domain S-box protein [Phycisphaeraceae bacterium]MCB9848829.1 PAS domain S-box protein [Phycisphaeraceae bacterium]
MATITSRENDPRQAMVLTATFCAGAFCTILGLAVILGWWFRFEPLIRILPHLAPMQANTALGMLLSGAGMLAWRIGWRRSAVGIGSAAALLGLLTLVEYLTGSQLGIDELLARDYLAVDPGRAGRMAPNTALCFLLTGSAIMLTGGSGPSLPAHISILSIGVVVTLFGAVSLFGYASGIDTSYWMGNLTRMALHTSIGFLALGGAFTLAKSVTIREAVEQRDRDKALLAKTMHELELQKFALDEHAIVAITDPSGVITYVNKMFCKVSQYRAEELIGKTHRVINSGHHPREFFVDLWRTIAAGETWRGEVCNRARDGSLYWVDTTIVPFRDETGRITQFVAIRADVTQSKKIEQDLRRANAELEEYVRTASHDLKAPLVTIEGFSGYLRHFIEVGYSDRALECVDRIQNASRRLKTNIDEMLELSRIGRTDQPPQAVDVHAMLQTLLSEFQPQIEKADADVVIEGGPAMVHCDPVRVEQILSNLLSNALKYGHPASGSARITVCTRPEGRFVRLGVADNGPGIEPEFRERVFGLFQRLDAGAQSSGVGLNIVKRIVEHYGGAAWVEKTPGGGATFCVTLPAGQATDTPSSTAKRETHDDHRAEAGSFSAG